MAPPPFISGTELEEAVALLRGGGVLGFPTETSYGLAADPFNPETLDRIFRLKRRSLCKPLLTLVENKEQLGLLTPEIPAAYHGLMELFWPGPLTLIFRSRPELPQLLTGNSNSVGVRISSHPVALLLTRTFGGPITATSANISGQAPARTAAELHRQLGAGVDMIIDGGRTPGGLCSTIVSCDEGGLKLIRPGVIPFAEILKAGTRRIPPVVMGSQKRPVNQEDSINQRGCKA